MLLSFFENRRESAARRWRITERRGRKEPAGPRARENKDDLALARIRRGRKREETSGAFKVALAQAQAPTPALPGRKRKRETHLARAQGRDYGLAGHGLFKSCERISGISEKNRTIRVRKDTPSVSRSLCNRVIMGLEICRMKCLAGTFNLRATTNFVDLYALVDCANAKY